MFMRVLAVGVLLLGLPQAVSLAHEGGAPLEAEVPTEAKPWTSLDANNDPNSFQFAVVTDNAGGPRAGIFAEAVAKLNLLQPEFVMSIGDFIEGYEDNRESLNAQWDHFLSEVAGFEMPFFFVPGNHDNGRPLWAEIYNERFGVPYFHFVYKNVLFLCLSTNDGPENNTGIGQAQIDYAAKALAEHPDVRWTLVFQHKPLWNDQGAQGWKEIEALLKGRPCTVFAGHTHNYLSQEGEGISFVTLATTGGGSALRGPAYGEFDGVVWVTMSDEGPRIANVLLEGLLDRNLRTPESAKELALFRADKAVVATPVLFEGGSFTSGVSKVTITNPSEKPLRVKVLTETAPGIRAEPSTIATVIPGKTENVTELHISADAAVPLAQLQPVVLHWKGYYDSGANTPSLVLGGERRILLDSPSVIPTVQTAPAIDGNVDDWTDLPFVVSQPGEVWHNVPAWKGPQDGSFRFGVARDEEFLYVAVKATDNEPYFDGWKYWEDFTMVTVDGRASDSEDLKEAAFSVIAGPQISPEQAAEFEIGQKPEGVKTASVAAADGFTAEVAIPLASLNARQGGAWKRVRLNVGVSDFDKGDARDGVTILYWRPQWTSGQTYPESGVFVKE
ncbi:MAG: metallophosphoesterase [Candidatus Hydrogenedentes bacterium]|nr:metallophosphoesterase [Candidatus Hydrogenedentota bacterium]